MICFSEVSSVSTVPRAGALCLLLDSQYFIIPVICDLFFEKKLVQNVPYNRKIVLKLIVRVTADTIYCLRSESYFMYKITCQ